MHTITITDHAFYCTCGEHYTPQRVDDDTSWYVFQRAKGHVVQDHMSRVKVKNDTTEGRTV